MSDTSDPRITPITRDELSAGAQKVFDTWSAGGEPKNIFRAYFRNEALNQNWAEMAAHLFFKNSLSSRQREILVLRTCWRTRSDYEFINHLEIARDRELLTEEEMLDLTRDDRRLDWSPEEAALAAAADELDAMADVTDETWTTLADTLSDRQLLDAIVTVGGYTINSMATTGFGIDLDPEHRRDIGLTPSKAPPLPADPERIRAARRDRIGSTAGGHARIEPLTVEELDDDVRSSVEPLLSAPTRNVVLTLARHPSLLDDWMPVTRYTFDQSNLHAADAELICLRTSWLCAAAYEFTHHVAIASSRGLDADQILAVPAGADADVFDARQQLLLRAVDQLVATKTIDDALWASLREHYSEVQMMDFVFTCGNYLTISLVQNAVRIELEAGVPMHSAI